MDKELKMILGGTFVIITFMVSLIIWSNNRECRTFGEMTGMESKVMAGECYAKTTNGWFPRKQIRMDK